MERLIAKSFLAEDREAEGRDSPFPPLPVEITVLFQLKNDLLHLALTQRKAHVCRCGPLSRA